MEKNKKFLELLGKHNLTFRGLADKLDVSERAVQYWAKGRNKPSITKMLKMAKLFNMRVEKVYEIFKGNTFCI